VDDEEEEASLAVVAAGAAAGADEPNVVASDDVEDVEVEIMARVCRSRQAAPG
jgi:hypothetical protein